MRAICDKIHTYTRAMTKETRQQSSVKEDTQI